MRLLKIGKHGRLNRLWNLDSERGGTHLVRLTRLFSRFTLAVEIETDSSSAHSLSLAHSKSKPYAEKLTRDEKPIYVGHPRRRKCLLWLDVRQYCWLGAGRQHA